MAQLGKGDSAGAALVECMSWGSPLCGNCCTRDPYFDAKALQQVFGAKNRTLITLLTEVRNCNRT
jgi:hypothetical protein